MRITIRRATVDDATNIVDVINSVIAEGNYTIFDKPFSEVQERSFISALGSRSALYLAEIDGKIVLDLFSTLATSSMSHVATMGTWLRREFRGSGIGRLLAEESFRFAKDNGYRKIIIQVLADNEGALRFYRSLGFRDIGIAREHVRLAGAFYDEIYLEKLLQ